MAEIGVWVFTNHTVVGLGSDNQKRLIATIAARIALPTACGGDMKKEGCSAFQLSSPEP
jgi:hypothetical protein